MVRNCLALTVAIVVAGGVLVIGDGLDTVALVVAMIDGFKLDELVSEVLLGHLFG